MIREDIIFYVEVFVVKDFDVDFFVGILFFFVNDISICLVCYEIMIGDFYVIYYNIFDRC